MGVAWASDPFRERIEQWNRARWDGGTVLTMADATAPPRRWLIVATDTRPAITPAEHVVPKMEHSVPAPEQSLPDIAGLEVIDNPMRLVDLLTCLTICCLSGALSLSILALAIRAIWRAIT